MKKWLVILIFCSLGAILGFVYACITKPIYKATLSFALEDEKASSGLGSALGLASQFGIELGNGGGGAFSGDNLIELMKSRSIVERTLLKPVNINNREETLAERYIAFKKLRKDWEDKPDLKDIIYLPKADRSKFSLQQDSVLGIIQEALIKQNLLVDKVDKKLSIVTVSVKSEDQLFSKYFAEVLVSEVSAFYIDTKIKKSTQNVSILQHQTDSVRKELNLALLGVAQYVDATPNANSLRQQLRVPTQRRQVDVQADQAILTELVKNLELSKISLRKETPLIQIIDKPILPLYKERVGKIKGFIIGGFLAGFLIVAYLSVKRFFSNILS